MPFFFKLRKQKCQFLQSFVAVFRSDMTSSAKERAFHARFSDNFLPLPVAKEETVTFIVRERVRYKRECYRERLYQLMAMQFFLQWSYAGIQILHFLCQLPTESIGHSNSYLSFNTNNRIIVIIIFCVYKFKNKIINNLKQTKMKDGIIVNA